MPFGSEGLQAGTGLALSGGGFRATLFHCGALWRLNELGLLRGVDRVSSVSGGSITAGALAIAWPKLREARWSSDAFVKEVVAPLQAFCRRDVDVPAVIKGALVPGKTIADFVADQYADGLFGDATLQDLPDAPTFVFNSTNLSTGVDLRFSKAYAGDHRIGLIRNPTFKLATAVAASSAFPPFLSPVELEVDPAVFEKMIGADLYDDVSFRTHLRLTDGGVYDNLGLETVAKRYRTLLVSDAGRRGVLGNRHGHHEVRRPWCADGAAGRRRATRECPHAARQLPRGGAVQPRELGIRRVRRVGSPFQRARRRAEACLASPELRPGSRRVRGCEGRRLREASGTGGYAVKRRQR